MRVPWMLAVAALALAAGAAAPRGAQAAAATDAGRRSADVLVAFNAQVLAAAEAEDRFLTLKGLRTAAMMHLAAHDALNVIEPRYATYLAADPGASPPRDADPRAALATALHRVAVDQYPDRVEAWNQELERWLAPVEEGPARRLGVEIGEAAAARVLAAREGDDWDAEAEYEWHPMAPGVYAGFSEHSGTPEGFVFGAGWAIARPFAIGDPSRLRAPPPPEIDGEAYAEAYAEVKDVGRHESATRTADQAHLAMWWKEFVESSHNRLARELVAEEELGPWEAARLFALLEVSIYDGYLAVFDDKFHYNHWRPYTAIRWAEHDGNPATQPDPEWDNLHRHTYAFPSYPSAHGVVCAAAMTVMAEVFGDERPVTMTIPEVDVAGPFSEKIPMDPPTRSFPSFSAAAEECSLSRLYLGIHFRYDSEAGTALGRQVGERVVGEILRPLVGDGG